MTNRTYLDWNATAPLRPEAKEAMLDAMEVAGNPSSVHAEGRKARGIVEAARAEIARIAGAKPSEVVFTSGATEGAALLKSFAAHGAVMVQDTAHDCLWAQFDLSKIESGNNTLAMGLANGETGVITVPERGEAGYACGAYHARGLFLDAVQAFGKIPFSFHWSGADFAILSAHKIGGPKGVGALLVRDGTEFEPLAKGGGQELGRRSGTENVIGIAGFAAAAQAAERDLDAGVWDEVSKLRAILENALASSAKETILVGNSLPRLPNTSCFATPGWKGETQVMQMDLAGFAVSNGSACSSGKVRQSRVLKAMGLSDEAAAGALRVSLGPTTTEDEILRFAESWLAQHEKFRRRAA